MVKRNYWSEDDIYKLMEMKNTGFSYEKISKELNRTISACQTQVHNCKYKVDEISSKMFKEAVETMSEGQKLKMLLSNKPVNSLYQK